MARACGGRVIAAIRSPRTKQSTLDAGADAVFSSHDHDLTEPVRQLTDGWGADVVLDFVATPETLKASIAALASGGRLVIMGYFPRGSVLETLTWPFSQEIVVTGNRSAGRQDVADAVSLIQNGRIKPVLGKVFPLKDAAQAHRAFEGGEIVGRAVLVP
jgi:NADPH:quinone reductase-like Zn-dependent oxidoreductase